MHIEHDDHFLSDDAGEKLRAAQAIQGTTEVVLLRLSLRGRDTVMTNSCVMQREATHVQSMCYNSSQQSTYGIVYRLTSSVACATICAHHEQELRPLWCVQFKRLNRRSKFNGAERWPRADDDAHDDGDVIGQTWWCHSSFGWRSCGDSFGAHKEQFVDFLHILTPCFDFSQFVRPMSILTNSYASFDS